MFKLDKRGQSKSQKMDENIDEALDYNERTRELVSLLHYHLSSDELQPPPYPYDVCIKS